MRRDHAHDKAVLAAAARQESEAGSAFDYGAIFCRSDLNSWNSTGFVK